MVAHVVVPEGMAYQTVQEVGQCLLSDYYEAVLARVIRAVPLNGQVFLAPGNRFTCAAYEELYAADYLQSRRPDLCVILPVDISDRIYLDTFDNAKLLRTWLQKEGRWPLEEVTLYCNAPHRIRSSVLFRLCGFNVKLVVGCRPKVVCRKIVSRLWFYDYPIIQTFYEGTALLYNFGRWIEWKILTKNVDIANHQ